MQNPEKMIEGQALSLAAQVLKTDERDLKSKLVPNGFFRHWDFWRVRNDLIPPRFVILATHESVTVPIRFDNGFAELVATEPVTLTSCEDAIQYVEFFISIADPMADVISSVTDIFGTTAEEQKTWSESVRPPTSKQQNGNCVVELWIWKSGKLSKAVFTVDGKGQIRSDLRVVAPQIGVAISIE